MRLVIDNNVFIVEGMVYNCIYNLNTKKLFRIDKNTSEFINEISSLDDDVENYDLSLQQKNFIESLISNKIITTQEEIADVYDFKPKIQIEMAWIEITQKCNFRCIHCYEGEKIQKDMNFDDIKYCIDELHRNGIKKLQIIGGEPLLHPQIIQILKYCIGKFEEFSIFTNGSYITDEICEQLKQLNAIVYVSLHSDVDSEFNKITCTKNMLPKVMSNIEKMRKTNTNLVLKRVKVKNVSVSLEYESMQADLNGFPILVGNANIDQYDDEMLKHKLITEETFTKLLDVDSVITNMKFQYCFSKKVYIDVNLDVYPCILERRKKHGNLLNTKFENILNESICKCTKDSIDDCKNCEYRYACNTCFPDTASENFYAKPWFCTYNPNTGQWGKFDKNIFKEEI